MPLTSTLADLLLDDSRRPAVIADVVGLVDSEISAQGSLAMKGAYAVVKKSKPELVTRLVGGALPDLVTALEPHFQQAQASGTPMSRYLPDHADDVSEVIMGAIDGYVARLNRENLQKRYAKARGSLPDQIRKSLPVMGQLIEKYQAA